MNAGRSLLLICLLCLAQALAARPRDALELQRDTFIEAWEALKRGDEGAYRRHRERLGDYPLLAYLEDLELRRRLSRASDAEIRAFLDRHAETPLADALRRRWLYRLAERQAWRRFLAFYAEPQPVELRCQWLRARLAQAGKPDADWLATAEDLWQVGHSQPDACDPVFKVLYASGRIGADQVWARFERAMANGKLSLARFLAARLPPAERATAERWREAHRRPAWTLRDPVLRTDTPRHRQILIHAIRRLVRSDPGAAHRHWLKIADGHAFSPEQRRAAWSAIGLHAAYRRAPEAHDWLANIPPEARDDDHWQWLGRSALWSGRWRDLTQTVAAMPAALANTPEWQYWRARALEAEGRKAEARAGFAELALDRSFHGFLAADRVAAPYALDSTPIEVAPALLDRLLDDHPGLLRARELYFVGFMLQARREWYRARQPLSPEELAAAAVLASRWGWHDRAIAAAAAARRYDDLELRFPLLHREQVMEVARRFRLDPALIYGIMRQESAFMQDARSSVGALGLMQLMPATGRATARLLRMPRPTAASLLRPEINIRLGSAYYRRMLDRFHDQPALAAAAYNAGPHRVDRWLPRGQAMDPDRWIDGIPFTETRRYVRGVLAYATVYRSRLGLPMVRLAQRLPPMPPAPDPA